MIEKLNEFFIENDNFHKSEGKNGTRLNAINLEFKNEVIKSKEIDSFILGDSNIQNLLLEDIFWDNGLIINSNLSFVIFNKINFRKATLTNSTFINCSFINCSFIGASIQNSKFENAIFCECDFTNTFIDKNNFKQIILSKIKFSNTTTITNNKSISINKDDNNLHF